MLDAHSGLPFLTRFALLARRWFLSPSAVASLHSLLQAFHAWVAAFEARPSVRISSADRLPRSVAVQPFAATKRDDYIIEM